MGGQDISHEDAVSCLRQAIQEIYEDPPIGKIVIAEDKEDDLMIEDKGKAQLP